MNKKRNECTSAAIKRDCLRKGLIDANSGCLQPHWILFKMLSWVKQSYPEGQRAEWKLPSSKDIRPSTFPCFLSPSPPSLSSFNVSVYLLLSLHHLYLLSFKNQRFPRGEENTARYAPGCTLQLWGKEDIVSPLLPLGCNSGQDRTLKHMYPSPPSCMVSPTSIPVLLPWNKHPTEHESWPTVLRTNI